MFKGEYGKFTPWLVYSCFVWCGNVRDIFSAGGNKFVEDLQIFVSAIMYRTLKNAEEIKKRILNMTDEEQKKFWGMVVEGEDQRIEMWLMLVQKNLKISSNLIANNRKLTRYETSDEEEICREIKNRFMCSLSEKIR